MSRDVVDPSTSIGDRPALPTRDLLISAAMPVFRSHGYELTTVEDIARSAGLTTGAIYASFASKDELFYAAVSLVEDRFESWVEAGVRDLPRASSARDRLAAYLHSTAAFLQAEPDLMAFRLVIVGWIWPGSPRLVERMARSRPVGGIFFWGCERGRWGCSVVVVAGGSGGLI